MFLMFYSRYSLIDDTHMNGGYGLRCLGPLRYGRSEERSTCDILDSPSCGSYYSSICFRMGLMSDCSLVSCISAFTSHIHE